MRKGSVLNGLVLAQRAADRSPRREPWETEHTHRLAPKGRHRLRSTHPATHALFQRKCRPFSSTFATFGVGGFITAFFSLPSFGFLEDHRFTVPFKKSEPIQKGKRQSIAALQMTWQKLSSGLTTLLSDSPTAHAVGYDLPPSGLKTEKRGPLPSQETDLPGE